MTATRELRTLALLVASAGTLLAAAAEDEIPEMNRQVAAFARAHVGQKVGDGECTSLAVAALKSAGAKGRPLNRGDGDYVWGRAVDSFREALPGDIVQFRDAVFSGKRYVTSRRWVSWHYEYPHHTAVVASIRERGKVVALWHQNVGTTDTKDADRKLVTETTLRTESLKKGGKVWIYRPVASDVPLDPPPQN